MLAHTEIDLTDRRQPQRVVRVEQKADLDAVAGRERDSGQQLTGARVFTAKRLQYRREFRPQRGNMGRATNSVTRPPPLASSVPLTRSGRR